MNGSSEGNMEWWDSLKSLLQNRDYSCQCVVSLLNFHIHHLSKVSLVAYKRGRYSFFVVSVSVVRDFWRDYKTSMAFGNFYVTQHATGNFHSGMRYSLKPAGQIFILKFFLLVIEHVQQKVTYRKKYICLYQNKMWHWNAYFEINYLHTSYWRLLLLVLMVHCLQLFSLKN